METIVNFFSYTRIKSNMYLSTWWLPTLPTFWKNTGKIQVDLLKWGESGEQENLYQVSWSLFQKKVREKKIC